MLLLLRQNELMLVWKCHVTSVPGIYMLTRGVIEKVISNRRKLTIPFEQTQAVLYIALSPCAIQNLHHTAMWKAR